MQDLTWWTDRTWPNFCLIVPASSGLAQLAICWHSRLYGPCDYCVTPVPMGLEFGFGIALGLGLTILNILGLVLEKIHPLTVSIQTFIGLH